MSQLIHAPHFLAVRSITGALAADTAYNDTNFPPSSAISHSPKYNELQVYWTGNNAAEMDAIDIRILVRNTNDDAWLEGPLIEGLAPDTIVQVNIAKAGMVAFAIETLAAHAGITNPVIYAALGSN
jgi:hypothetical protein